MKEMESILITGGGGYLGSELARYLIGSNYALHLADLRFNRLSTELANRGNALWCHSLDITDYQSVDELCKRVNPSHIFHFAAFIDRSRDPDILPKMLDINVRGTLNLLTALKDISYQTFCFASTSEVYGTSNPLPFREDITPQPVSPYSLSKWMAEELIRSWSEGLKKPWLIYRIFNFFGKDMPPLTFVPQLLDALRRGEPFHMTAGEQRRDYLHIDDLLWYIRETAFSGIFRNEVLNLCSGESISMNEIADILGARWHNQVDIRKDLPYRPNEIWEIRGDSRKLRKAFPSYQARSAGEGLVSLLS
jgi:nucleoside-diphosphate-sugar epimerase